MARTRVSTTVDCQLLEEVRHRGRPAKDAQLFDDALRAYLAEHRSAEVDSSYDAYEEHPLDEPDEWGDLASWHDAMTKS